MASAGRVEGSVAPTARSAAYWDGIAALDDELPSAWRRRARDEHLELLHAWIGSPSGRWFKTDLFEELSDDRALISHLATATWIGGDISAVVAKDARNQTRCIPVVFDTTKIPFADGALDGILSTSTLDHFEERADIDRSLAELRRVLRVGGQLVLTLDNPRNPLIRLRNALPRGIAQRTGLVPFSVGCTLGERSGRAALAAAGFAVERSTHLLHAPHVVGTRLARFGWYERRVLPRFAALARSRVAPITGHYVAFLARAI